MKKLLAAVTVLAVSTAQADTIYVDASCPGGDGSELDPYCSIQTAIDNAVDTDEVVVAPGTYFETVDFLGKAVTLRSSDGPDVTTIDGTGNFHVVRCVTGEGSDTVLDGFTITGGNANGVVFPDNVGGGMWNDNSSPTVTNCTFTGNSTGSSGGGGGMYNGFSSPTVTDCLFSDNVLDCAKHCFGDGGGMHNANSDPTVTRCTFTGNSAGYGGGMHNRESSPTVTDCTFASNCVIDFSGGGMSNFQNSSPTVTNCTFVSNSAECDGGGMFNTNSSPTVTDCTFSENSATIGGGMSNVQSSNGKTSPTVANCTFSGNTAPFGGGMYNLNSSFTVTNCTFSGNTAVSGGGMLNHRSSPTVTNCTFTGNTATQQGGGMADFAFGQTSLPILSNCVLWNNSPDQIFDDMNAEATVGFSDVQGGWPGTGNIDADPLFVDPDNGDLRLLPGSPCIDAGHNNAISDLTDTDLDGNPRFADDPNTTDTGCGVPVIVDMGAYEYQGVPATVVFADLNGDGIVTFMGDLMILNGCVGSDDPDCCVADLDLDGVVGMSDRILMWGELIEFLPVR